MSILDIMPHNLREIFTRLSMEDVNELRLRANAPVIVCVNGRNMFMDVNGRLLNNDIAGATLLTVTCTELETILHKASNYSIYAINDQMKNAFITIRGGIRIGIAGEVVVDDGHVKTIKNIGSLNIRVPHEIRSCSYAALNHIFENPRPLRALIIAPPGAGKTTFLRDIAWQISDKYHLLNTLVLDERGEIAAAYQGENQLDVGMFTDVISGASKLYGFENGIRSLRPDVVITDEVATESDIQMIRTAINSGVSVIASVHAGNMDEVRRKIHFREIIEERLFDRYIVLGVNKDGPGKIIGIYDKMLRTIAT